VGAVTKDHSLFTRQVLAVDGAGEPGRLGHKPGLLVNEGFVITSGPLLVEHLLNRPNATGRFHNAHGGDVHIGHVEFLFQILPRCVGQLLDRAPG
jgi:hypothetical protein